MRMTVSVITTKTRTPAFWGYLHPLIIYYPYYWVILDPKSKEDKVKVTNLKNLPKLHATHLLKLLNKMCKYEIDPTSSFEDTERTRFCPQTETDGHGDTSIPPPPFNLVDMRGIINMARHSVLYTQLATSYWAFESRRLAILCESGRHPLIARQEKLTEYLLKLTTVATQNQSRIVYDELYRLISMDGHTAWCSHVRELLKSIGLSDIWEDQKILVSAQL